MKSRIKSVTVIILVAAVIFFGAACSGNNDINGFMAEYTIGDTGPCGGIIFYVADGLENRPLGFIVDGYGSEGDSGFFKTYTAHYLEVAPQDSGASEWGDGLSIPNTTYIFDSIDSDAKKIGNGRKDTMLIVAHLNDISVSGIAAKLCTSESIGGKNDWFLPSLGELDKLYKLYENKGKNNYANLKSLFYWSSSQQDSNRAWALHFGTGNPNMPTKHNYTNYVRAVRAF